MALFAHSSIADVNSPPQVASFGSGRSQTGGLARAKESPLASRRRQKPSECSGVVPVTRTPLVGIGVTLQVCSDDNARLQRPDRGRESLMQEARLERLPEKNGMVPPVILACF